VLEKGNVLQLFVPFFLLGLIWGSFGISVLSFGLKETIDAVLAVRFFFFEPTSITDVPSILKALRATITSIYALSAILFVFGLIITMNSIGGDMAEVGHHIASCFCVLVYALFFAECLVRPLIHNIEGTQK
jgi:flagellar motor component MotA